MHEHSAVSLGHGEGKKQGEVQAEKKKKYKLALNSFLKELTIYINFLLEDAFIFFFLSFFFSY